MGRSTAAASEAATAGPTVRLGTKWLSMTSKCTRPAPPLWALRTSSASSAKSAASIEGAPTTLSPSFPKNVKSAASHVVCPETAILQRGAEGLIPPHLALSAISFQLFLWLYAAGSFLGKVQPFRERL